MMDFFDVMGIAFKQLVRIFSKQTDVSAECEDSIQFADNNTSINIYNSDIVVYNYN